MGKYSDSDDDRSYRKKKKHRSRSRSLESDSSYSSRYSKSKKSKKSKHSHRSRSRSRSSERYKRSKRRSISRDRSRSASRSKGYKSRRSRSTSRSRRSHSRTRSRRSRSGSRSKNRRSRSRSKTRYSSKRGKSRSRSREKSRRSSPSKTKLYKGSTDTSSKKSGDPCSEVPGFEDMNPAEQTKIRMTLALKAAAAADEKLKEMEGLPLEKRSTPATISFEDQKKRIQAIEEIESESFTPSVFKSSRSTNKSKEASHSQTMESSHDSAIFGVGTVITQPTSIGGGKIVYKENQNLAHPSLYLSMEEKMESWCRKLAEFRRRKLEGEAM